MKKLLILTVFLFCAIISFAQTPYPNLGTGVSSDSTLYLIKGATQFRDGAIVTRYSDTASANVKHIANYPGAQIFVSDTIWTRNSTNSKWLATGIGFARNDTLFAQLPAFFDSTLHPGSTVLRILRGDGIVSGGIVTWSGQGLIFNISPSVFIKGGKYYNSPAAQDTLHAANLTYSRQDLFVVDTTNGGEAIVLTGTPSPSPVAPQADIGSQFALTTGLTVNPGDTIPSNVILTTIYDENTEWITGTQAGASTVNFNSTVNPKHLTKAAFISKYSDGAQLFFIDGAFVRNPVQTGEILKFWVYLNGTLNPSNNIYASFVNFDTLVAKPLLITSDYGFNRNDSNQYQLITIPLSAFQWQNGNVFTTLEFTFTGEDTSGAKGLHIDYIQLQTGINNVPPPTDYSNKADSTTIIKTIIGTDTANVLHDWVKGISYPRKDTIWTKTLNFFNCNEGIAGDTSLCIASTTPFISTGHSGGVWTSSNTAIATVNSSTGVVTGVAVGLDTVTYTITNTCGIYAPTKTIRVQDVPNAGTSTASQDSVEIGKTVLVTNLGSNGAGIWVSSNINRAVVNQNGYVVGIATGYVTISYVVSNSCGSSGAGVIIKVINPSSGGINNIAPNLIISTNIPHPTGVLHDSTAFGSYIRTRNFGLPVSVNLYSIDTINSQININISGMVQIPDSMFYKDTVINGIQDNGAAISYLGKSTFNRSLLYSVFLPYVINITDSSFANTSNLGGGVYLPAYDDSLNIYRGVFKNSAINSGLTVLRHGLNVGNIEAANGFTANVLANVPTTTTLQNAFDAAPTANPQINAHSHTFYLDSTTITWIKASNGVILSGGYNATHANPYVLSTIGTTSSYTFAYSKNGSGFGFFGIDSGQINLHSTTNTKNSLLHIDTSYFTIRSDSSLTQSLIISLGKNYNNSLRDKVLIHADTLATTPTYIWIADGDTLKKYPYSSVGSGAVLVNGTTPLTANWNAGAFNITSNQTAATANTVYDGFTSSNTTTASAGNQMYSPAIHFTGYGWKTNTTAASQATDWRIYNVPVQGTTNPTSNLTIDNSINGGSYSPILQVTSGGGVGIGITPTAHLHITAGTATANTSPLKFTLAAAVGLTVKERGVLNAYNNYLTYTDSTNTEREITQSIDTTLGTKGVISGTNATAGNVGENISGSGQSSYTNYTTTSTYQALDSVTLTAGDWDLTANFTISANSATITTSSNAIFAISTTTASVSGTTEGLGDIVYIDENFLGTSKQSGIIHIRKSISSSTKFYLNSQASFSLGNPQYVCSIRARRMR